MSTVVVALGCQEGQGAEVRHERRAWDTRGIQVSGIPTPAFPGTYSRKLGFRVPSAPPKSLISFMISGFRETRTLPPEVRTIEPVFA
jgi:hypothetical protein